MRRIAEAGAQVPPDEAGLLAEPGDLLDPQLVADGSSEQLLVVLVTAG
jgi:hypothetical protein